MNTACTLAGQRVTTRPLRCGQGTAVSARLERTAARHFYRFTSERQANYVVYTRGSTDTWGELYDERFNRLTQDGASGGGSNFLMSYALQPGRPYYVMVGGQPGEYSLHVGGPEGDYTATTVPAGTSGTEQTLRTYIDQFPDGRFLTTRDPPDWFGGQCVAWAKALFGLVASRPIDSARGHAGQLPASLAGLGFRVSEDPLAPQIGAMIAWAGGGYGHVGVVSQLHRDPATDRVTEITVSEANFALATEEGARRWGISLTEAREQSVTANYGLARYVRLSASNLNRGTYRFSAYVYP